MLVEETKPSRASLGHHKRVQIAVEYYRDGLSQSKLASRYGVNQSTISHILRVAREKGIIRIDVDPTYDDGGEIDEGLSREVRDVFDLQECLVVEPTDPSVYVDSSAKRLHSIVASLSGPIIADWIRSGEHIAVGGGRGAMSVANFLRRVPPGRRDIEISPLSGRLWAGAWQRDVTNELNVPLDADDVARTLNSAFSGEPGIKFSQIGCSLFAKDPGTARQIIEHECVFTCRGSWKTDWGFDAPVRALVGIGSFSPDSGHRMNKICSMANPPPNLKVPIEEISAARSLIEKSKGLLPFFGDVANRLFAAVPLPQEIAGHLELEKLRLSYLRLNEALQRINDHTVAANWEQISGIRSVWAVAAGKAKVHAIWTLVLLRFLNFRYPHDIQTGAIIKELSTDRRTAETLLEAADILRSNAKIADWYRQILPDLFCVEDYKIEWEASKAV